MLHIAFSQMQTSCALLCISLCVFTAHLSRIHGMTLMVHLLLPLLKFNKMIVLSSFLLWVSLLIPQNPEKKGWTLNSAGYLLGPCKCIAFKYFDKLETIVQMCILSTFNGFIEMILLRFSCRWSQKSYCKTQSYGQTRHGEWKFKLTFIQSVLKAFIMNVLLLLL